MLGVLLGSACYGCVGRAIGSLLVKFEKAVESVFEGMFEDALLYLPLALVCVRCP